MIEDQVPVRDAAGYQYLNDKFELLHTTSVPVNDQEALEYFSFIKTWFFEESPKYITRRELDSVDYKMMPYRYNDKTGKITRIEGT